MSSTLCVWLGLAVLGSGAPGAGPVDEALRLEQAGRTAESRLLLERALVMDPHDATARGLLGQVQVDGRWLRPADVAAAEVKSTRLHEYRRRRAAAADNAAEQWSLAEWCGRMGLTAEAKAHYTRVTRLEPSHEAAWIRLGYRRFQGRWMSPERIAEEKAEIEAQRRADLTWFPRLLQWRRDLLDPDPQRREAAGRAMASLHDPRAVPAIVAVLDGSPRWQTWAVYLLGRIDAPQAALALASLAISSPDEPVREAAIRKLAAADPQVHVGFLINQIRPLTRYEILSRARGESGAVVRIETSSATVERHYEGVPVDSRTRQTGRDGLVAPRAERGERTDPVRTNRGEELRRATRAVDQKIAQDMQPIDEENRAIQASNNRVLHALRVLTGKTLGADQDAWTRWWNNELGYRYQSTEWVSRPLIVQDVTTPYVAPPPLRLPIQPHSCFGTGTPVHTRTGLRPIEQLKVGDQVLSQDAASGVLSYQPVLTVFHNPPADVMLLVLDDGDQVIATDIHRFWQAGQGWKMTRELEPGDRLRLVGGTAQVREVVRDRRQLVYNLEVAGNGTFFVGRTGLLVHDAALAPPVAVPFDAAHASAAATATARRD